MFRSSRFSGSGTGGCSGGGDIVNRVCHYYGCTSQVAVQNNSNCSSMRRQNAIHPVGFERECRTLL